MHTTFLVRRPKGKEDSIRPRRSLLFAVLKMYLKEMGGFIWQGPLVCFVRGRDLSDGWFSGQDRCM